MSERSKKSYSGKIERGVSFSAALPLPLAQLR